MEENAKADENMEENLDQFIEKDQLSSEELQQTKTKIANSRRQNHCFIYCIEKISRDE